MSKRKVNPYRRPIKQLTQGDLDRIKKDAVGMAIDRTWAIFFSVLRDEFGFENDKLSQAWKAAESLSESIAQGYVDVEDLMQSIYEEAGILLKGSEYQKRLERRQDGKFERIS